MREEIVTGAEEDRIATETMREELGEHIKTQFDGLQQEVRRGINEAKFRLAIPIFPSTARFGRSPLLFARFCSLLLLVLFFTFSVLFVERSPFSFCFFLPRRGIFPQRSFGQKAATGNRRPKFEIVL